MAKPNCPSIQDGCMSPDVCNAEGCCHYTGSPFFKGSPFCDFNGSPFRILAPTTQEAACCGDPGDCNSLTCKYPASHKEAQIHGEYLPGEAWPTGPVPAEPAAMQDVREHPAAHTYSKPTNPKDAIGVRKVAMSVLPFNVLSEAALGLMEGAAKYGRHNYRGVGVRSSVYYDATMRHLGALWEGEDIDPDSGLSHVTKAICSLIVWRDAMMQGKCTDDRPPRSVPFMAGFNSNAADILDRHADKSPKHYTIADAP